MAFIIDSGTEHKNKFLNGSLLNPTAGSYNSAGGYTSNNQLWGVVYYLSGKIILNGCTIEKGTTGSGNLTTAIYKYNEETEEFEKVENTNINTWNTTATGFQTVTISETVLNPGIYLNALVADTNSACNHSAYTTQWPTTPLGLDSSGVVWQGLTKASFTYVSELPETLEYNSTFWTYSNAYYNKFASFLLNHI